MANLSTITSNNMEVIKDLLWFYHLLKPRVNARSIYRLWYASSIFKDYQRPGAYLLEEWFKEFTGGGLSHA
jgi:hypothetical protein